MLLTKDVGSFRRYCDWRIRLPKGYQVVIHVLDLDITPMNDPVRLGYSLTVVINDLINLVPHHEQVEKEFIHENSYHYF